MQQCNYYSSDTVMYLCMSRVSMSRICITRVCIQVLYHRCWYRAVETARSGLNASLLINHPENEELFFVNLDSQILELLQEAKYLQKMNLEIHEATLDLCQQEETIKKTREAWVLE